MTPITTFQSASVDHPANQSLTVRTVVAGTIGAYGDDIARLRAATLRDWPYLYGGDASLATQHLRPCLDSWRSIAVLVFDGSRVVGASTGLPLGDTPDPVQRPFAAAGIDVRRVFLFGESMLLPAYRGRGLGHRFFDERETHARMLGGFDLTAFCAVERDVDDPRRPPFGRGNESFWRKRGYRPREGLKLSMSWNEVGAGEVRHTLGAWLRPLERSR